MGGNAVGIHFLLPMLNLSFPLARYLRGGGVQLWVKQKQKNESLRQELKGHV